MKGKRLLHEISTLAADGLLAALFSLGQLLPFFFSRGLPVGWLNTGALTLLALIFVILFSRRWWLLPALVAGLGGPVALILTRLKLWPLFWQKALGYFIWTQQVLIEGSLPDRPAFWLFSLQLALALFLAAFVWAFIRRWASLGVAGLLLLASSAYYLIFTSVPLAYLLPGLAALIALLPDSLARQQKKTNPTSPLPAVPKWLALPVAVLCVLLANQLVPQDTSRWVQKDLLNLIQDWGEFFQSDLAQAGRQPFDISLAGYPATSERLGGPVSLNDQVFLTVTAPRPVLLRGSVSTIYTGSSWQNPSRRSYRLGSPLWQLLERQVFLRSLPAGPGGQSLASRYRHDIQLQITPRSRWRSTIFQAGQLLELDFPDRKFYPPYFNWDGDLFVRESFPPDPTYSVTLGLYDQTLPGFAAGLKHFQQNFQPERDSFWPFVQERYLQLPAELPQTVVQKAKELTAASSDPYDQAELLRQYLISNHAYTLEAELLPPDEDFVEFFLQTGQGYCVHFATAMTVMARSIGLPARYVEGFTLKATGPEQDSYQARSDTAHAWAEIYLPGIGWLEFDATPAAERRPEAEPVEKEVSPTPQPPVSEAPLPEPEPEAETIVPDSRLGLVLLTALGLLLLALLVLALLLGRRHRQRIQPDIFKRLHPRAGACLMAAFSDLQKQLVCWDLKPETGQTMLEFAQLVDRRLGLAELNLSSLIWPVLALAYGGHLPTSQQLDNLLKLRQLLERRLEAELGKLAWFFKRVLPAFFSPT